MASPGLNNYLRYEPDDRCPPLLALAVGAQGILIVLAPTVLIVAITVLAAGQSDRHLSWSVSAALIIVGLVTVLQAARIGRLGGGHVLVSGVTPNYIAVSVIALDAGGPAMLASLIALSALFYLAMAAWLPLLRRVITPVVSGTVLLLLAATILPFAFDRLSSVPAAAPAAAGPVVALVTLAVSALLILRAPARLRPWSLLIGILAGCASSAPFGLYELGRLSAAPWVGLPEGGLPGLDFTPTAEFWALLPMFLVVTLVQAIKNIGDGMVVQRVSRRRPRATDFRLIQGSIYANGLGVLLSGIAGTPPTTSYSTFSVSLFNLTGVAARRVGYVMGAALVALALVPKLMAILLVVPSPVMGGFLLVAIGILVVEAIRTLSRAGLSPERAFVAGLAFSVGLGIEQRNIFEQLFGNPWGTLLGNGITMGAFTAIGLTALLELARPRGRRLEVSLAMTSLPQIDGFLREIAGGLGWDAASTERLRSAGEETLSSLLQPGNEYGAERVPRLIVLARPDGGAVEMEYLAVLDEENLEDRMAYLEDQDEASDERELSFRLLRHHASSVRHQKYQGLDVVTVRVDGSK